MFVGLMGSGKTTVGELVATRLARPFVDSDQALHARTGCTAAELQERDGAASLHRLEADLLLDQLARRIPCVIAAAASTIEDDRCRAVLGEHTVVWLRADVAALAQRAATGRHRPLDDDVEAQLRAQEQRRAGWFEAVASRTFDATATPPADIATQIVSELLR